MKQLFIALITSALLISACSKNYFQSSTLSPTFDKSKVYRVVLAEPQFNNMQSQASDDLKARTYTHLSIEMQKIRNLQIVDRAAYERELRVRRFGANTSVDANTAREAAKAAGAQLIAFSEISTEAVKGGLPILASVQLLDLNTGNTVYQGRARMKNPASLEAGVEFALEKALEELVLKTK
jgi:hypothetical protein